MAAMDGNAFCDKYHEELQKTAKAIASAGKGKVLDGTTTKLCIREAFACEGQCSRSRQLVLHMLLTRHYEHRYLFTASARR
jgi:hypothetical protein